MKPALVGPVSIPANGWKWHYENDPKTIFPKGTFHSQESRTAKTYVIERTAQMPSQAVVGMKNPKKVVIEWIDHILDRKKWDGTKLARESGLAPSTILRLINDPDHPFVPSLKTLQKIAEGSGYPIPRKVTEALGAPKMEAPEPGAEDDYSEGRRGRSRTSTVELRHVSSLPAALQASAGSKRDAYVAAPPQLEGDETAFAFYMPDDTLDPLLKSGSLIFVTKRRDPVGGDLVMITDKNDRTRVRLMTGIDESGVRLTKITSTEEETVGFDDLKEIAIIVATIRTV
jgi:transcriptional regulator with XRE-family HTH domain